MLIKYYIIVLLSYSILYENVLLFTNVSTHIHIFNVMNSMCLLIILFLWEIIGWNIVVDSKNCILLLFIRVKHVLLFYYYCFDLMMVGCLLFLFIIFIFYIVCVHHFSTYLAVTNMHTILMNIKNIRICVSMGRLAIVFIMVLMSYVLLSKSESYSKWAIYLFVLFILINLLNDYYYIYIFRLESILIL